MRRFCTWRWQPCCFTGRLASTVPPQKQDEEDLLGEALRGEPANNNVVSSSKHLGGGGLSSSIVQRDAVGTELAGLATREIALEAARDEDDGLAALPPLIPDGWKMEHPPGSNFLLLRRKQNYRSLTERLRDVNGDEVHYLKPAVNARKRSESHAKRNHEGREPDEITLFCPMRFKDPSFHEPTVDLCEWVPFDCLVCRPQASSLFLRLASVNSELRIRTVQHISRTAVAALGSHVATFLPMPIAKGGEANKLDIHRFGVQGDYLRTLLYSGPTMTEMSAEFREQLMNYVTGSSIGITPEVVEYVCQMLYFAEQDEYMRWLGRLRQFSMAS